MNHGKVAVTVGGLSFSAEGDPQWLAEQLDKILKAAAAEVATGAPKAPADASQPGQGPQTGEAGTDAGGAFSEPLGRYIAARGAANSQVKRFLATADWLRRRGATTLTTRAVTAALKDGAQRKLTNPADCLNQNVVKGFCKRAGRGFFITPDGLKSLGSRP
jgi:hypothetical protein